MRPPLEVITRYVQGLRDQLRLQAWDIDVSEKPPEDDDCEAQINPSEQRWMAVLFIADSMFDQLPEDQRIYFVHELLHLTHAAADQVIRLGEWRHQVGQALYDQVVGDFKREIERMVDFNARLIAPRCPLPPWTEPSA